MKESALSAIRSEMQSPETVYGMPAHKDRTAAVNEARKITYTWSLYGYHFCRLKASFH